MGNSEFCGDFAFFFCFSGIENSDSFHRNLNFTSENKNIKAITSEKPRKNLISGGELRKNKI